MNPDVYCVVREAGERTRELCEELAAEQCDRIDVICERPFHVALARGFELGIAAGRPWTLCLDADILLFPGAVAHLRDVAATDPTAAGAGGWMLDKFYGDLRVRGAHLYRTSLLPIALDIARTQGGAHRPETRVHETMAAAGNAWLLSSGAVGLHGYAQAYGDIFRTNATRAVKSSADWQRLFRRASLGRIYDADFAPMLWGLEAGASEDRAYSLDSSHWTDAFEAMLAEHAMAEKGAMSALERRALRAVVGTLGRVPRKWVHRAAKRLVVVQQRLGAAVAKP